MLEISFMYYVKVILQTEVNMKDWNSITVDRYYEQLRVPSTVAIGILNISRDINSKIVNKRTLDMTYFYINRMVKAGLCDCLLYHI